MSNIHIKDINHTNEDIVKKIKLRPEQESFIETVDECLEEAHTYKGWKPVAIYEGEKVIGFAMYGSFGDNRDTWIDRLIIDEQYQGNGRGRIAMEKLIDIVTREYQVNIIHLSIVKENRTAYHLYKSLGFQFMNEYDPNGELLFRLNI